MDANAKWRVVYVSKHVLDEVFIHLGKNGPDEEMELSEEAACVKCKHRRYLFIGWIDDEDVGVKLQCKKCGYINHYNALTKQIT